MNKASASLVASIQALIEAISFKVLSKKSCRFLLGWDCSSSTRKMRICPAIELGNKSLPYKGGKNPWCNGGKRKQRAIWKKTLKRVMREQFERKVFVEKIVTSLLLFIHKPTFDLISLLFGLKLISLLLLFLWFVSNSELNVNLFLHSEWDKAFSSSLT